MKQGKTLQELGRELQRQRLNRQDFLADTRALEMESDFYGSTLHLSLDGKTYGFGIEGRQPSAQSGSSYRRRGASGLRRIKQRSWLGKSSRRASRFPPRLQERHDLQRFRTKEISRRGNSTFSVKFSTLMTAFWAI